MNHGECLNTHRAGYLRLNVFPISARHSSDSYWVLMIYNPQVQHDPAPNLLQYVIACLVMVAMFLALTALVTLVPTTQYLDAALSNWLQQYRSTWLDSAMVGITMLGDSVTTAITVCGLALCLLVARRWWLAIHLTSVYLSAKLAVSIIKALVASARPELANGVIGSYSFPSGHACSAAVAAGLVAVIVACNKPVVVRYTCYSLAALVAILVAISRVYLLAHWPSDVLAGLAIACPLVVAFAWQLHTGMPLTTRALTPIALTIPLVSYVSFASLFFATEATRYGISVTPG